MANVENGNAWWKRNRITSWGDQMASLALEHCIFEKNRAPPHSWGLLLDNLHPKTPYRAHCVEYTLFDAVYPLL